MPGVVFILQKMDCFVRRNTICGKGLEIIRVTGHRMLDSEDCRGEAGGGAGEAAAAIVALCRQHLKRPTDQVMEVCVRCVLFEDASDQKA